MFFSSEVLSSRSPLVSASSFATADDAEIASLDPYHPATFLPLVASRLHAVQSYLRNFRVSELIDAASGGFRERIRHESASPPPVQ